MELAGAEDQTMNVEPLVAEARQDGLGEHRELRGPRARRGANHEDARGAFALQRDGDGLIGDARTDRRAPQRERNRRLLGRETILAAAREDRVDGLEVAAPPPALLHAAAVVQTPAGC